MWSKASIPIFFPTSVNLSVTAKSSRLGGGSPEGWLWARMIDDAESFIAGRKTSLG